MILCNLHLKKASHSKGRLTCRLQLQCNWQLFTSLSEGTATLLASALFTCVFVLKLNKGQVAFRSDFHPPTPCRFIQLPVSSARRKKKEGRSHSLNLRVVLKSFCSFWQKWRERLKQGYLVNRDLFC